MQERLSLKSKVLNENQRIAETLRERFRDNGVLCLNLISSPGSGKTALLGADTCAPRSFNTRCGTDRRYSDR